MQILAYRFFHEWYKYKRFGKYNYNNNKIAHREMIKILNYSYLQFGNGWRGRKWRRGLLFRVIFRISSWIKKKCEKKIEIKTNLIKLNSQKHTEEKCSMNIQIRCSFHRLQIAIGMKKYFIFHLSLCHYTVWICECVFVWKSNIWWWKMVFGIFTLT